MQKDMSVLEGSKLHLAGARAVDLDVPIHRRSCSCQTGRDLKLSGDERETVGVTGIRSVLLVRALTAPAGGASGGLLFCWSCSLPHRVHVCQPRRNRGAALRDEAACPSLSPVPKGRGQEWKWRTAEKFTLQQGPSPTPPNLK